MKIIIEVLRDEQFDVWETEVEIEDTPKMARNKAEGFVTYFQEKGFAVRETEVQTKIYEKCTL